MRCATADRRANHSVATAAALRLPEADLPIDPYALGVWLGDGHSASARFTSADPEIAMLIEGRGLVARALRRRPRCRASVLDPAAASTSVAERCCEVCGASFVPQRSQVRTCGRSCGGKVKTLSGPVAVPTCPDCGVETTGLLRCQPCHDANGTVHGRLRTLGVLGNKHIPSTYLRASEQQRRDLLAGLLDTDGTVNPTGSPQIALTSRRLAEDVRELVHSSGYRTGWSTKRVARPDRGLVDRLHAHLHDGRRGVRARAQAAGAQGASPSVDRHG